MIIWKIVPLQTEKFNKHIIDIEMAYYVAVTSGKKAMAMDTGIMNQQTGLVNTCQMAKCTCDVQLGINILQ
jgi:hypothetical protein